jgi:hypothetical protein
MAGFKLDLLGIVMYSCTHVCSVNAKVNGEASGTRRLSVENQELQRNEYVQ